LKQHNLVDKDRIDLVKAQFNFMSIPVVVFTDNAGKEIKKFTGFDKNYEGIINKFIE